MCHKAQTGMPQIASVNTNEGDVRIFRRARREKEANELTSWKDYAIRWETSWATFTVFIRLNLICQDSHAGGKEARADIHESEFYGYGKRAVEIESKATITLHFRWYKHHVDLKLAF